jgi:hypothetical protein
MKYIKNIVSVLAPFAIIAVLYFGLFAQDEVTEPNSDDMWPKVVQSGNMVFKVYQPQLDSWDGYTLKAHSAVGVQKGTNENELSYGVANFTANALVDKDTRRVKFEKLMVEQVKFPSEPAKEDIYLTDLRSAAPIQMQSMSLDNLEANLAVLPEQKKGEEHELQNIPPKIIFSKVPAILVLIDGKPVFAPVKDTNLSRLVNTRELILKDTHGKLYLHVFDGYLESFDLNGTWKIAKDVPSDVKKAEEAVIKAQEADLLEGEEDPDTHTKPSLKTGKAPVVYIASEPTELVVTNGEPNYVPVDGTSLLYIKNTTANVFKDISDQETYFLVSGRWFRAPSPQGPWEYVPANNLPEDFAKISDQNAKENVKASVAGTKQAQEAVIANSVPTTEKIDRKTTTLKLDIDGEPEMKSIDGTPLSYVYNCAIPVIMVDENTWYAVFNGVWFYASRLSGPWMVADSVPAVVYSIPVNSPLHYVTYVRVYDSTPEYVYVGYTPGYYGTVVNADGVVVYGSGYYYHGYLGRDVWYPPIYTYGYGWDICWTPWYGWGFGIGFGWGFPGFWYYPCVPWWGPFYTWGFHFHHPFFPRGINTARNLYHGFGNGHVPGAVAGASFAHGRAYNSRTGALVIGTRQSIHNVFAATPRAGAFGGARPAAVGAHHIYATREGHVFTYGQRGWRNLNGSMATPSRTPNFQRLNQERAARELGNSRASSYQQSVHSGGAIGGTGGGHGGGRGGWDGGGGGGHRR